MKLFSIFALVIAFSTSLFVFSNANAQNKSEQLMATIKTDKGDIIIELYGDKTPLTVGNFINLAKRGYYDGLKYHRVIENFMIQGGCPLGTGTGDPGYKFEDETRGDLKHTGPGILSMANSGANTNGSQFFITHVKTGWLDGKHTVFGKVIQGQDVVDKIKQGDKIIEVKITGKIPNEVKEIQSRIDEWNKVIDKKFPDKFKAPEKL